MGVSFVARIVTGSGRWNTKVSSTKKNRVPHFSRCSRSGI